MDQLVVEVERSVAKILEFAQKSSSKVYLCGHSAGAHLAAMMLYVDFTAKYPSVSSIQNLAGFILVSGCYRLEPLLRTDVNDNLKMNAQLARQLSPLLFEDEETKAKFRLSSVNSTARILVCYGEHESPAFIEQSKEYARLLSEKQGFRQVELLGVDADHFDVIENLRLDDFILTQVRF